MNIHGFLCINILNIHIYIYIYGHIYRMFHRISRSEKVFFCDHLPFQEQQSCTKLKWENNGKHGMFFQFTETLVKTGWIALRMEIL